jgi:hypothetical protein
MKILLASSAVLLVLGLAACTDKTRDDATITSEVIKSLADEHLPASIEVATIHRVVTLSGPVTDAKTRGKAEDVAEDVRGVDHVVNHLTTVAGDAPRSGALPPADVPNPMAPRAPQEAPETR